MKVAPFERVVWSLRRAALAVETAKELALREVGLPVAHYALMINLVASPGINGAELSRRLGVSPQNTAALVKKLEDQGLVVRRTQPRNPHVRELHLTDSGRAAVQAADDLIGRLELDLRDALGDGDAATLHGLLERIVAWRRDGSPRS